MVDSIILFLNHYLQSDYLLIIILTLLPFLELRASIPYGVLIAKLGWMEVGILAIISNIIIGPLMYIILDKFISWLFFIKFFKTWYQNKIISTQLKIKPLVQKYGLIGIAIFIGIPLPGSGVYSGAIAAYVINLGQKKFFVATVLGVIIAAIIVTTITLFIDISSSFLWNLFIKKI